MRKSKLFLGFLFLIPIIIPFARSQNLSVEWIKASKGLGWENVNDMIVDGEGNTVVIGNYNGNSNISGLDDKGYEDVFIVSFNKKGELQWRRSIFNDDYCYVSSILSAGDEGYYITGFFRGQIKFGSYTFDAENKIDSFIAQMNKQGQAGWLKTIKGDLMGSQILLESINNDEFILACNFKGSLETEETIYNSIPGTSDIVVIIFDNKGKISKARHIQGTGNDFINDLTVDKNSKVYLGISFEKELRSGLLTLMSKGMSDGAIITLDDMLNTCTIKQLGSSYKDNIECVELDGDDNLIVAGIYSDEISGEEMILPQPNGKSDIFICKIDKYGETKWADSFGGKGSEFVSSIAINKSNSIYLSGNFRGEIVPGDQKFQSVGSSSDYYIARFDTDGKLKFIETFNDTLCDFTRKIMIDNENYIYLAGNSQKFHKDDKNNAPIGLSNDFYLAKLYDCDFSKKINLGNDTCQCGDSFTIKADTTFKEYTWNDGSAGYLKTVDTTGLYSVTTINDHNCTSTDSIYVKLNPLPVFDLGDTIYASKGEIITLYGPSGMKSYNWGNGSTLNAIEIYTDELKRDNNQIRLCVMDVNGCVACDHVYLKVNENGLLTNLNENSLNSFEADIFPNPAISYLYINISDKIEIGKVQFELISSKGEIVWSTYLEIKENYFRIKKNIKDLNSGFYLLAIRRSEISKLFQIIKK